MPNLTAPGCRKTPPPTPAVTVVAPAIDRSEPLTLPPPGARGLSNEELREVQAKLRRSAMIRGRSTASTDQQTVSAVKRYEIASQLEPTGNIDLRLLERPRREP